MLEDWLESGGIAESQGMGTTANVKAMEQLVWLL